MARNAGDLALKDVPQRQRGRLAQLASWGLVRFAPTLKRYELTALGWHVLNCSEAAYYLSQEKS